jgi:hypothetical protein
MATTMPSAGAPSGTQTADPSTGGAALPDEKLIITGSITLEVDEGDAAVAAIRTEVDEIKGRVVLDDENGADHSWSAHLTVRLPPGDVQKLVDAVAKTGRVVARQTQASDVSREYFDQEIALKNLHITLDRLQALLGGTTLTTADVLQIEGELTRIRGQIEQIEGDHQFLEDRIAFATLDIYLSSTGTHLLAPKAHVYPGLRATALYLIDAAAGQEKLRPGASAVLWFARQSYLELEIFPSRDDTGRAVIATAGGGGYSDFFGGGKRRYGNPFLGARIGYGWVGGHHELVAGGEIGVELLKTDHVTLETAVRGLGLFGKPGTQGALELTAGLQIPF